MKIALSGAQNTGKSTLLNEFLKQWPMYKPADNSYREIAKKNSKVKLNTEGSEESQIIIRDAQIDQAMNHSKDENVIFDRCVLDNLVYSLWLNAKGKVTDLFIERQIPIIKEAFKFYDIIFFIPKLKDYDIPIVPDKDGQRCLDPIFQEEIDNIFKAVMTDYWKKDRRTFFPMEDCPAIIDILAGPVQDRLNIIKLYVKNDGNCYGEEDSLLKDEKNLTSIYQ
jgi:predicted ATPase